jgi:processive 1,2-diacylglycerol beta-glucosyltransferase
MEDRRGTVSEAYELQPSTPAATSPGRRVLILSAEEGEGHRAVARALQAELAEECEVVVYDALEHLGRVIPFMSRDIYRVQLRCMTWTYWLECAFFARFPPGRAIARMGLALLGSRPLMRLIRRERPDVIVSTHPAATSIIGYLRRRGKLRGPALATVSDFGVHPLWAHRGIDLHLVVHDSCLKPVERVAGQGSARVIRPPVQPQFFERRTKQEARRALDLPRDGTTIVVSGGGWGIGKLERAVRAALELERVTVICICGHNGQVRGKLEDSFKAEPRVRVLGFTQQMSDLVAACDAVVHSTAGVTCLEALVRGRPIIAFGSPAGHARWNARAIAALGMGDATRTSAQLTAALRKAIDQPLVSGRRLTAARPAASLIVSARPRVERPRALRRRIRRLAATVALTSLVAVGWTFASATPYPFVSRMLHLRPATTAPLVGPRIALVVDAPQQMLPAIASKLEARKARATFALDKAPDRSLIATLASFGDSSLPTLHAKTLPHWISVGRGLQRQAHALGLGKHFYYLVPRKGFTFGEYVVARAVGGRPLAGAVRFEAGRALSAKTPQAGDVVVLTLEDSSLSSALATVDAVTRLLSRESLRAVPFPGSASASRTAPTAGDVPSTPAPATISTIEATRAARSQKLPLQVSPARTGASATGTSVVRARTIGAT